MSASVEVVAGSSVRAAREIVVVFARLRRRMRDVAAPEGLTPSQAAVLSRLSKDGVSSGSALAVAEGVKPQSMASIIGALEERGLVFREPDPVDGRRQLITLTAGARDMIEDTRRARQDWLSRELDERFNERERSVILQAFDLLHRVTQA